MGFNSKLLFSFQYSVVWRLVFECCSDLEALHAWRIENDGLLLLGDLEVHSNTDSGQEEVVLNYLPPYGSLALDVLSFSVFIDGAHGRLAQLQLIHCED